MALGIAASGGAVGQAFIPHLSGYLIDSSGWQSAYLNLALIYAIIAFPIAFLIKESPWRESARDQIEPEPRSFPISEKEVVICMDKCGCNLLLHMYVCANYALSTTAY